MVTPNETSKITHPHTRKCLFGATAVQDDISEGMQPLDSESSNNTILTSNRSCRRTSRDQAHKYISRSIKADSYSNKENCVEDTNLETLFSESCQVSDSESVNKMQLQSVVPSEVVSEKLSSMTISPKLFYSSQSAAGSPPLSVQKTPQTPVTKRLQPNLRHCSTPVRRTGLNKRVHHKVRRSLDARKQLQSISLPHVISLIRNERLRELLNNKHDQTQQVEKVHEIMRKVENPIAMAKPLTALAKQKPKTDQVNDHIEPNFAERKTDDNSRLSDFSDMEDFDNVETESTIAEDLQQFVDIVEKDPIIHGTPTRKFFKTGYNMLTRKEVNLFSNVRASMYKGKISLIKNKPKTLKKSKQVSFSDEQATVDAILRHLDDASFMEKKNQKDNTEMETTNSNTPLVEEQMEINENDNELESLNNEEVSFNDKRTDESFEQLISLSTTDHEVENLIGKDMENTDDDENLMQYITPPISPTINLQSSQKLFPLFYSDRVQPLTKQPSTRIKPVWHGMGENQLQIDAGQRSYGSTECKQCGLLYTMHVPEEENLHHKYHESQHMLRFNGWVNEEAVARYPQWGGDGRILRLNENSHFKHGQRLMQILAIVDAELGYKPLKLPETFVAYLAVRQRQIVGVCLVVPIQTAGKYICINGQACVTMDHYEAKFGVSRIWVAPLYRRRHIATHLLDIACRLTLPSVAVSREDIAFSSPTDAGRDFAQSFTGKKDFLLYQQ